NGFVAEKMMYRLSFVALPYVSNATSLPSFATAICALGRTPSSTSFRARSSSAWSLTSSIPAATASVVVMRETLRLKRCRARTDAEGPALLPKYVPVETVGQVAEGQTALGVHPRDLSAGTVVTKGTR